MQHDTISPTRRGQAIGCSQVLAIVCLMFTVAGTYAAEPGPMYSFVPRKDGLTDIAVDCARRAEQPVSRLLYGKFAEHLGRNIYHGMWAQLVHNPGFAAAAMWGSNRGRIASMLTRRFGMQGQAEWVRAGLPPGWAALGDADRDRVQYAGADDVLPSRPGLRIDRAGEGGARAGIQQVLDLPIARQRDYEFSAHVRAARDTQLTVRLVSQTDPRIAAEKMLAIRGKDWRTARCALHLPSSKGTPDSKFRLEIGVDSPGTIWLDQCLLFPADHLDGWDSEVVRLTKESKLSLLRWPGGNFVSGYHWKDGVGPAEKRPMRLNRPWNMPEPNYVGTDEFMRFCQLVGCEPMICVNAGDGTAAEAADWVEYCNGSVATPMGRQRAANGHPEPYRVRYWEIGNELYGKWQIGHCTADEYAPRYRKFVEAMRQRDPTIRFIANGHNFDWNRVLVDQSADILRSVSLHVLIGGGMPTTTPPEKVWWSIAGYPWEFRHELGRLSGQLRSHVADGKLAITELQIFTNRPNLPNNGSLAEAMFWAGIVNMAVRAGDRVELVTHSALLNHGGGLRKQNELVYPNPVYFARKLYSTQPGRWPVAVHVEGPAFSVPRLHNLPPVSEAPRVDVLALVGDTPDTLVLLLINHDPDGAADVNVTLSSFRPMADAKWQWISGGGILAANSVAHPDAVKIQQKTIQVPGARFSVTLPARSLSAITLRQR